MDRSGCYGGQTRTTTLCNCVSDITVIWGVLYRIGAAIVSTEQLKVFCCRHTRRQAVSQDDHRTYYDADDDADADADDASVARSGDVATT